MSADDVIAAIQALTPAERATVVAFVHGLELSGDELETLAKHLLEARTADEANAIEEKIVRGFYGTRDR